MKEKDFRKLTKKQKLEIKPDYGINSTEKVLRALFLPIRRKMSGYGMAAIFVETEKNGWTRVPDYDCFCFTVWNPNKVETLRGDFEYGGIVFFLGDRGAEWRYFYDGTFEVGKLDNTN